MVVGFKAFMQSCYHIAHGFFCITLLLANGCHHATLDSNMHESTVANWDMQFQQIVSYKKSSYGKI